MLADRAEDSRTTATWLEVACSRPVVMRALGYLVVVGAILIAINHGDAILAGDIDRARTIKIFLTPLVPYMVSTMSSVAAKREAAASFGSRRDRDDPA